MTEVEELAEWLWSNAEFDQTGFDKLAQDLINAGWRKQ
jgi:hypothetical protein